MMKQLKSQAGAVKDWLLGQLGYQLFITPLRLKPPKHLKDAITRAKDWFYTNRDDVLYHQHPHPYVLHCFKAKKAHADKILITHGWMSCAAYMARQIHDLREAGFDVYALDFPAHGDASGYQITWEQAVDVIVHALNRHGPFHGAMGHSFGGAMLLNVLNLSSQMGLVRPGFMPQKMIFLASPTRMRTPLYRAARRFKFTGSAYRHLRTHVINRASIHPKRLRLKTFLSQKTSTDILCIHGEEDATISYHESTVFCSLYPHASLLLRPKVNHLSILSDDITMQASIDFLKGSTAAHAPNSPALHQKE